MAVHERMARWLAAFAAVLIALLSAYACLLLDDAAGDFTRTRMYRDARLAASVLTSARAWDDRAMLESAAAEIAHAGAVVLRLYSPEGSLLVDSDTRRGRVSVQSRLDEGSTFKVFLPSPAEVSSGQAGAGAPAVCGVTRKASAQYRALSRWSPRAIGCSDAPPVARLPGQSIVASSCRWPADCRGKPRVS